MIKTNTTPKKSTAKKAAPKKTTAVAAKKTVAKKTTTVAQKATVATQKTAPKKTTPKKSPVKKIAPSVEKVTAPSVKKSTNSSGVEGVKMLGILHLAGNLLSGGTLGLILSSFSTILYRKINSLHSRKKLVLKLLISISASSSTHLLRLF